MYEYAQTPLYNPMINPYLNAQRPFQQQPRQEVVKVNGENGARAFPLGANSSALLLDESGVIVWLVTTDGAGYKTVAPFDITPHEAAPAPDYNDLETRIKRLEEMMTNGNSGNPANARQAEPAVRADQEHGRYDSQRGKPASTYAADDAEQSGYVASGGLHPAARQ